MRTWSSRDRFNGLLDHNALLKGGEAVLFEQFVKCIYSGHRLNDLLFTTCQIFNNFISMLLNHPFGCAPSGIAF